MDPISEFKERQKAAWSTFGALEHVSGTAAPHLVRFAGIRPGDRLLDVACGTGVVALTAARLGAKVTGLDLTPELIAHARENAALMEVEAQFQEGDAEALPFGDASFDVVLSQFGHMFAPRPEVVVREMLRVLKPGGRIAFSTWPPELLVGRMFAMMGRYNPPPPPGVAPPQLWGDPNVIVERLGGGVRDVCFAREALFFQMLSVQHYTQFMASHMGPAAKHLQKLDTSDPAKGVALRRELSDNAAKWFENNAIRQDFLMTRAVRQ